jgi:aryl-alcohol dehydrogenase-like predicted oxidoreductase
MQTIAGAQLDFPSRGSFSQKQGSAPTPGTRFTLGTAAERYQDRYWHEREFRTVEALRRLADQSGHSLTSLAIAWVLENPAITAPIIGASRPEQLPEGLKAATLRLEQHHFAFKWALHRARADVHGQFLVIAKERRAPRRRGLRASRRRTRA